MNPSKTRVYTLKDLPKAIRVFPVNNQPFFASEVDLLVSGKIDKSVADDNFDIVRFTDYVENYIGGIGESDNDDEEATSILLRLSRFGVTDTLVGVPLNCKVPEDYLPLFSGDGAPINSALLYLQYLAIIATSKDDSEGVFRNFRNVCPNSCLIVHVIQCSPYILLQLYLPKFVVAALGYSLVHKPPKDLSDIYTSTKEELLRLRAEKPKRKRGRPQKVKPETSQGTERNGAEDKETSEK